MKKEVDKNRVIVIVSIFVVGAIVILGTMGVGNVVDKKYEKAIKDEFGPYKLIRNENTAYFGESVKKYEIEVEDSFEECDNFGDNVRIFYMNGDINFLPVLEQDVRARYSSYGTIQSIEKKDSYQINYLCMTDIGYDMCSCKVYDVFVATIKLNEPFRAPDKSYNTMMGVVSIYGNKVHEGYI